ncbi:MAG: FkbM family methyltransferase [Solirubrobacterales bacterium]|nr:FkbM family methyltransferase [Solirubrobacterales bacterium]
MPSYEERRIEITSAVRDTDPIPKVPRAGDVEERNGTRVQIMHNGVVVEEGCYWGDWTTEIVRRLRGHHEPQEEAVFHVLVERLREDTPAPVMLELGSFWAYYSLWLKRAIPATRCLMLEPDPNNLAIGQRNFSLNGVTGEFIHAPVTREHGAPVRMATESDGVVRRFRGLSVDGLIADKGLERIDLLLSDVQGAELDALLGATRAMQERRIRFFVISTHHHSISRDPLTHQKCLRVLEEAGAHVIAEHSVPESCSGDGLIAASLDPRDADLHVDITVVRARDSLFGELEWDLAAAQNWRHQARRHAGTARRKLRARVERLRARRAQQHGLHVDPEYEWRSTPSETQVRIGAANPCPPPPRGEARE